MASSNIKLFDENKGNMLSDSEFSISNQRMNGLQTGIASSQLQNKAMYQASLMAYAIAQVMMQNGKNANDTDAVSAFVANLSGTMLQKVYDIATTDEAKAGVATGKWMSPALVKAAIDAIVGNATKEYVDYKANELSTKVTALNNLFATVPENIELLFEKQAAGTYTVTIPSDAKYVYVYAVGAGGGGGGGRYGRANGEGGNGGGAGYERFVGPIDVSSITNKTVVVGTGGAGGAGGSSANDTPGKGGSNGGETIVFGVIKAAGGSGGVGAGMASSQKRTAGSAEGGIGATSYNTTAEQKDGGNAANVRVISIATVGSGGGGGAYAISSGSGAVPGKGGTGDIGNGGSGGKSGNTDGVTGSTGSNGGVASGGGGGGGGFSAAGGKGGNGGPGYVAIWISRNKKAF